MIAADTSSLQRYLESGVGRDVDLVTAAAEENRLFVPPVVLAETFSNPGFVAVSRLRLFAVLEILPGYWERAGLLRRSLVEQKLRAKLPDCLIAQSCIDHDIPLITYDRDFRHFERAGLKLL